MAKFALQLLILFQWCFCDYFNGVFGFHVVPQWKRTTRYTVSRQRSLPVLLLSGLESDECGDVNDEMMTHIMRSPKRHSKSTSSSSRRQILQKWCRTVVAGGSSSILTTMMAPYSSLAAVASADDGASSSSSTSLNNTSRRIVSLEDLASRLRKVPTFTIVDKRGVPFMVFGEDAKLTTYFFTSYKEASRILSVASASSDKAIAEYKKEAKQKKVENMEEDMPINPWKEARISSVPLDFAVTLANKGKFGGAYFRVAPSEDDIKDALSIDTSVDDLSEGKVPLFYLDNFELQNTDGSKQIPLYFRKSELLAEWKRQHPKDVIPDIQVTELFSVLTEMASTENEISDPDVAFLTFIPPKESAMMEKKCVQQGGTEKPFILGERIIVL